MSQLSDPATWRCSLGPGPQEACLWWVGMSLGAPVPVDGRDGYLGGMKRGLCWSVSTDGTRPGDDVCAGKALLSSPAVGSLQALAVHPVL